MNKLSVFTKDKEHQLFDTDILSHTHSIGHAGELYVEIRSAHPTFSVSETSKMLVWAPGYWEKVEEVRDLSE